MRRAVMVEATTLFTLITAAAGGVPKGTMPVTSFDKSYA
jgi:hypothetical protein